MSEPRYPNESKEYRKAREALLKDEQELIAKVKSVGEKRRKLSQGGNSRKTTCSSGRATAKSASP